MTTGILVTVAIVIGYLAGTRRARQYERQMRALAEWAKEDETKPC